MADNIDDRVETDEHLPNNNVNTSFLYLLALASAQQTTPPPSPPKKMIRNVHYHPKHITYDGRR